MVPQKNIEMEQEAVIFITQIEVAFHQAMGDGICMIMVKVLDP
jgi:hypothetical protein